MNIRSLKRFRGLLRDRLRLGDGLGMAAWCLLIRHLRARCHNLDYWTLASWTATHRAISRLGCVFAFVASGFRAALRAGRGRGRSLWRAASPFREVVAQV